MTAETFRQFLIRARDELLHEGVRATPESVVDQALTYDGAWLVYNAERDQKARAKARIEASKLLSEVESESADPEIAQLFDTVQYQPPRALAFLGTDGVIRHVAIEHATRAEADSYEGDVLESNIAAAVKKRNDFRAFRRQIEPYLAAGPGALIAEALRRMRRETAA